MFWFLLIAPLLAQDTGDPSPEPTPAVVHLKVDERVHVQQVEVLKLSESIEAMKTFLRDEIMREDGFAPKGWTTPDLEVYEAHPDRPSFLPLESVMNATAAGKAEPGLLAAYTTWLTEEAMKKAAQETP